MSSCSLGPDNIGTNDFVIVFRISEKKSVKTKVILWVIGPNFSNASQAQSCLFRPFTIIKEINMSNNKCIAKKYTFCWDDIRSGRLILRQVTVTIIWATLHIIKNRSFIFNTIKYVCLFVFNVPPAARSFRDGTPIYCPLRRTWSSVNTPSRPGIEPGAVAWQFITLPLRHGRSTH